MTTTKNPAAVALGSIKSPAKAASSAANGAKGGRPRTTYRVELVTGSRLSDGTLELSGRPISRHLTLSAADAARIARNVAFPLGGRAVVVGPDGDQM